MAKKTETRREDAPQQGSDPAAEPKAAAPQEPDRPAASIRRGLEEAIGRAPAEPAAIEATEMWLLQRTIEEAVRDGAQRAITAALAQRDEPPALLPPTFESSGKVDGLMAALAKAQGELRNPVKDKTATIASDKGRYSYDYADLASVLDVVRPVLSKHGIAILQPTTTPDARSAEVKTALFFGGEWIAMTLKTAIADGRPQTLGSAITYLRRYGLQSLVGITAEQDDDANQAQGNEAETGARQRSARPQGRRQEPAGEPAAGPEAPGEPAAAPATRQTSRAAAPKPEEGTVGAREGKKISEAQRTRLQAIVTDRAAALGVPPGPLREKVRVYLRTLGVESSKDLPVGRYEEVVKFAQMVAADDEREPGQEG